MSLTNVSGKKSFPTVFVFSVLLTAAFWIAASLFESHFLGKGSIVDRIFLIDSEQMLSRPVIALLLLAFGAFAQSIAFRRQEAQRALRESEDLYRTLVATSPDAVTLTDLEGKITYVSPRAVDLYGYRSEEMVGKSLFDFISTDETENARQGTTKLLAGDTSFRSEWTLLKKDGSRAIGETSVSLVRDQLGSPKAFIATTRDVTGRRKAEEALKYRYEFEKVITTLSSRFITQPSEETDSNITYALKTIGEFTGVDRAYVFRLDEENNAIVNTHEWCAEGIEPQIGKPLRLPEHEYSYVLDSVANRQTFHIPKVADLPDNRPVVKKNLMERHIKSVICVPMARGETIIGFLGFDSVRRERSWSSDVTVLLKIAGELLTQALDRQQTERALRDSEEKYRSFVQNFQGMAFRSKLNWVPLFFHGAVEQITGYTEAELIAGTPRWDQIIHPDDWNKIQDSAEKIRCVPNFSVEREYRIVAKDGQIRWLHELSQNICDYSGEPRFVQGALYDVTERVRMENVQRALYDISEATNMSTDLEDLLKTIHQILGTLIDTTNFYVALYDETTGRYSFPICVDQYDDGSDLEPEELEKSLTDYVRKSGQSLLVDEKLHQQLEEKGEVILVGEPSPIWMGVPLKTPHGVIGVVTVQSYSDPNLYKESDVDLMNFVSGHIAMAIERKQQEMLMRHSEEEHRTLVETMRDGVMKVDVNENIIFANAAAGFILGYDPDELIGMNLRDIVVAHELGTIYDQTRQRLERRRSRYDLTVVRKDEHQRQVSISAAPCLDDRGNVVGTVGVFTDITELKRAQEEGQKLREKLANAQRMESLGVLAGGVAHDLNNILGPLVGYPEIIKRRLPPDSPVRDQIAKIEESAQRAAEVVQDLLTMGRRGRYEMSHVDINRIVTSYLDSAEFANYKIRFPNITTEVRLATGIPSVYGSATHLSKVIMNLVLNALDAMPDGGLLTIKSECRHLDQLYSGYNNIEPGRYNIITVSDTGIGIDEVDTKRIFDPFFSKKKLGKSGSGLGLSVVYAVIKDHNGYVDVKSEPEKGSDFIVYLPAIETAAEPGPEMPVYDIKGCEKLLVVDDVAEQRDLAQTLLSGLGYEVVTATCGREAVEYMKSNTVDVVVLDMIMEPDFDGLDTYRAIVAMHPGQKAVIVSGFSQTDRVREAEKLGVTKYVKKPYTMQKLGKAIREVIVAEQAATGKIKTT